MSPRNQRAAVTRWSSQCRACVMRNEMVGVFHVLSEKSEVERKAGGGGKRSLGPLNTGTVMRGEGRWERTVKRGGKQLWGEVKCIFRHAHGVE